MSKLMTAANSWNASECAECHGEDVLSMGCGEECLFERRRMLFEEIDIQANKAGWFDKLVAYLEGRLILSGLRKSGKKIGNSMEILRANFIREIPSNARRLVEKYYAAQDEIRDCVQ